MSPFYSASCIHMPYERVYNLAVVGYWRPRKMIYANISLLAIDIDNKDAKIVCGNYWDYSALEITIY